MEKIVEYLDTASKRKSRVKEIDSKAQQAARKVVKDICAHIKQNPSFKVMNENGEELTVDDLMNLESIVLDVYKEDEEDN